MSPVVITLVDLLSKIKRKIDQFPASDISSSRFGKAEFRDFYDNIEQEMSGLLEPIVSLIDFNRVKLTPKEVTIELKAYLVESWGNRTRIDYGSGHELNFMMFLFAIKRLGLLNVDEHDYNSDLSADTRKPFKLDDENQNDHTDATSLVLKVFVSYLGTMRAIQYMYWLEPAGSHGVWGLDDYHFLPFLFGSSQLACHKYLKPISIHNADYLDMYADKYLYFGCIKFINQVKTASSLRWHSPMLDDISGVKTWGKVNQGMIKMYMAEVLGKLPVMQHFMFGKIINAPLGLSQALPNGQDGENHVHYFWAECCGIKIPSAIAASANEHKGHENFKKMPSTPQPLPFD
ncbi:Phosphotyrosyl phosphatase activator [Nadsonia fulvescens var. elongata DSM 6958]|uniref:Serine/threonine-protein phosphatase 2A activator n=1 Tax=Nadsonia fulvescens var. elongata DSM 6958 TaxID=857566 RepID=A0A1E3PIY4_9ASCO|nr:Phosphotyrosyl phosphatase activator [Nadsonia fulvescens var. elongata DSM 6958]